MEPIVALADVVDAIDAGGKAWNLARLSRAGLPVPPTAVVPADALRFAASRAGLWHRIEADDPADDVALGGAIARMPLPGDWESRWAAAAARLGGRVAVRSSAVGEDGPDRTQAGAYHSELGVVPAEVGAAVARVWASGWSPAARAVRGRRGAPRIAVVIQAMLDPDASGVLFTINPLNGSWREMVVEAVFGLGDALVGGQVAPHGWIVRRPRRVYGPLQRIASRVRLQVVQEDLPDLPEARRLGPGGIRVERSPGGRSLDTARVLKLCRLGLRIEAAFGAPQDVEWALVGGRFAVLQARPVTSAASPRLRTDVLWTRRFIGERFPEPPTPLSWSILEPMFSWFIAYPDTQDRYLGGGPALRLHAGRPYLNATVFRHLAFKLPGAPAPRFMLELVPPEEVTAWNRRLAVAPDWHVYASILRTTWRERRWERFRWNPFTNHRAWEAFRVRLETALPVVSRRPVTPADAVRLVEDQLALLREYVGIHLCSLLFANLWYQVLEGALAAWVPDRAQAWTRRLATCPDGNLTLATNRALWEVATVASNEDLAELERGSWDATSPFGRRLEAFLAAYGHRSEASWEILAARWRDHPERLVPLLASSRSLPDPAIRAAEQARAHREALAEVQSTLSGGRRRVAERLIELTRTYLLLRENQRFWFDRLVEATQRTALWLGAWLATDGWLADEADVALLTWQEVSGLASGKLPFDAVPEWVARRRAQRDADLREHPPVFLRGDQPGIPADVGGRLTGLGISPGCARGRVRVIRTLADGVRLEPGEILVAHALDPGWTALLLTAGGVALELGGVLSHGAVVAREYGRPAVVNLDGVTRRLRDGQEVTVDGTRGTVWIHP